MKKIKMKQIITLFVVLLIVVMFIVFMLGEHKKETNESISSVIKSDDRAEEESTIEKNEVPDQLMERIEEMKEESGRFGYYVSENFVEREYLLSESDFQQLSKNQYLQSVTAENHGSEELSVIETIGMFDGLLYYNPITLFHGNAKSQISPYYKIDDDTYVVLLFKVNRPDSFPLESVEVWDSEGNKLRDINIE